MKSRMQVLLAVLRKDLRLFWPLAVLTAALRAVSQILPGIENFGPGGIMVPVLIPLFTALLVLVVFYEDAVVSVDHDWLTRPIAGMTLLAAKALFLVLAIFVPSILGGVVHELNQGHALGESLLAGIDSGASSTQLLGIVMIMAFAAITTGFRQGIVAALVIVAGLLVPTGFAWVPSVDGISPSATSSGWVVSGSTQLLLAVGAGLVLWLQYRHRRTWVARGIAAAAPAAALAVMMTMTWTGVFAIQKMMSRDPAAAALVNVGMPDQCFAVREMDGARKARYGGERIRVETYDEQRVRRAGPGALAFSAPLIARSVPKGHLLEVDHIDLTYRVGGRVVAHPAAGWLFTAWVVRQPGVLVDNLWLLRKDEQQLLAAMPGVESHFVYSLSLLEPVASATLAAGAPRSYSPGIGYCRVTKATNLLTVECFKPGIQPAQLIAEVEGATYTLPPTRRTDFTPAALELWGGAHFKTTLYVKGVPAPRVRLTAYEARAHFDREIDVPGVLGGPLSMCPIFPVAGVGP